MWQNQIKSLINIITRSVLYDGIDKQKLNSGTKFKNLISR